MTTKFEGVKDDLDVLAIVKSFEAFKDAIQLVSDKAESMTVDLDFDSTYDPKTHYTFKQDELVQLNGAKVNPLNKKIAFGAIFAATDKFFYNDEAELITVALRDEMGALQTAPLQEHIKHAFAESFAPELKVNSLAALQAMLKNNAGLVDILNDPGKFIEEMEKSGTRSKAYAKLENFGRY